MIHSPWNLIGSFPAHSPTLHQVWCKSVQCLFVYLFICFFPFFFFRNPSDKQTNQQRDTAENKPCSAEVIKIQHWKWCCKHYEFHRTGVSCRSNSWWDAAAFSSTGNLKGWLYFFVLLYYSVKYSICLKAKWFKDTIALSRYFTLSLLLTLFFAVNTHSRDLRP